MFSLILELEWCWPGWSGGLVPEIRLGFARFAWCRGSLLAKMRSYEDALQKAKEKFLGVPTA